MSIPRRGSKKKEEEKTESQTMLKQKTKGRTSSPGVRGGDLALYVSTQLDQLRSVRSLFGGCRRTTVLALKIDGHSATGDGSGQLSGRWCVEGVCCEKTNADNVGVRGKWSKQFWQAGEGGRTKSERPVLSAVVSDTEDRFSRLRYIFVSF